MKVSIYKKYNSPTPTKDISIFKILDEIKTGVYAEDIKKVRFYFNDKVKKDEHKKKLPLVGFGGTFTTRGNSNLKASSGIACLDYDHLEDVLKVKEYVNNV